MKLRIKHRIRQFGLILCFLALIQSVYAQSQVEQVRQSELRRNYNNCVTGIGFCNKSELTSTQMETVHRGEIKRNYNNCASGIGLCNQSQLTENEVQSVKSNQIKRNLNNCNAGIGFCDRSVLSSSEIEAVQKNALQRNYNNCATGIGYCNKTSLTEAQIEIVHKSELKRNYNNCVAGIGYCNKALLDSNANNTTKTTQSIGAENYAQPAPQSITRESSSYPANTAGPCAENGSCYGDISNVTGLPKTVPVSGYYRKDGTYVRGHYRSHR